MSKESEAEIRKAWSFFTKRFYQIEDFSFPAGLELSECQVIADALEELFELRKQAEEAKKLSEPIWDARNSEEPKL